MAKRKCKHGKTKAGPCRKGPKKHKARKAAKRSAPKASLSVAKRISAISRKRCGNPSRLKEVMATARYIGEIASVERRLGPDVRPIAQVKRNLRSLKKTALRLVHANKKCTSRSTAIVLHRG